MARSTTTKKSGNVEGENITLDFDAVVISPDVLKKAVSAFVELLKAVTESVCGNGKRAEWNMILAEGSRLVVARPVPNNETAHLSQTIISVIPDGLKRLEKGTPTSPLHFNERALRAARELAGLRKENRGIDYLRIRSIGKPTEFGERAIVSIDYLLGGQHQALGTIEGKLRTLTDRGTLQFVVYDSLYDRGVNCFITDELAQGAMLAFRKRVAVSGMIQYDREGHPASIRVDEIKVFKDIAELPNPSVLRGIFTRGEAV